MRTVPQRNGLLIYLSKSWSKDRPFHVQSFPHPIYPFYAASAAAVCSFLCRTLRSFLSLHHVNVLLPAFSQTTSVLPTVETLSLKTLAFAFAFQSMKIGLIIAKCLPCLIVIDTLSEARFHWFDTIWISLWTLLVVTQSQTSLIDGVLFDVTVTNDSLQKDQNGNQWECPPPRSQCL